MPRPVDAGTFAERLYTALSPYSYADATNNWSLLVYLGALGKMSQIAEDYASDGANGQPGWSQIVDLNRAPTIGLPWLGQFVGATVNKNLADADQRQQLRDVNNWARGSVAALQGAPAPYLTGLKTVILRERDAAASPSWPAYGLTVITYASESGDANNQAKILAAITAQKPAGIILNYQVKTGQDYQSLFVNNATYQQVFTNYATYQGVVTAQPGT